MRATIATVAVVALTLLARAPSGRAAGKDEIDPAIARLRDALRNTMIQLRAVEGERATLQAASAQLGEEKKGLETQVKALARQATVDKESISALDAKLLERDAQVAALKDDLEKANAAIKQASDIAATKEAERARYAERVIGLDRRVAELETKNHELFKVGNEILTRYERFGLGTALTAREPFIGVTRVKLQNLVQDYQDKLLEHKDRP